MESKIKKWEILFSSLVKSMFLIIVIINIPYLYVHGYNFSEYTNYITPIINLLIFYIIIITGVFFVSGLSDLKKIDQFKHHLIIKIIGYDYYYYYLTIGKTIGFLFIGIYILSAMFNLFINYTFILIVILYIATYLLLYINFFVDSVDLTIVYLINYTKYHQIKDLKIGFDYLNNLHERRLNKDLLNRIINNINSQKYIEPNKYNDVFQNFILTLKTKNLTIIRSDSFLFFRKIDSSIKTNEMIKTDLTLADRLSKFLKENYQLIATLSAIITIASTVIIIMHNLNIF
ncbi:MAG: hypothetical protein NTV61_04605 [Candidatus Bathyarchaeota archaeon]|nr:hypothetical protein [Candidatus Bathyarchaeota archaeon]